MTEWKFLNWEVEATVAKKEPAAAQFAEQTHGREDFLITTGKAIGIRTADCLPLVLLGEKEAALVHVSRKTLVNGQLENLATQFPVSAVQKAWLGPHICSKHFVFEHEGPEIQKFKELFPNAVEETVRGLALNIEKVVVKYLEKWGISEEKIEQDTSCTFESEALSSYKRERGKNLPLKTHIYTTVRKADK